MHKRIFALFLAIVLTLSAMPWSTHAEELTKTKINVRFKDRIHEAEVYRCGGDLYFSGEDLWAYTYYDYEIKGSTALFTLGAKKITIDLYDDEYLVTASLSKSTREWRNPPVQMNGQWYFSGADLLPWLNVTCGVKDGNLVIVPDEHSFWEILGNLDLSSYSISYASICLDYAWDSKVVKALKYTDDHVGEKLLEAVNIEDEYGGNATDYYDILECFLLDKSHTEYAADALHEKASLGLDIFGVAMDDYGDIFTALQWAADGALYAANYAAFTKDDSDKMQIIDTLFSYRSGTQQLNDGANLIKLAYSSWWNNILTNYVLNLDEKAIDKIQDKLTDGVPLVDALLLAVDVSTKDIQKLNDRIKLMAPYLNLYSVGNSYYCSGHSGNIVMLEDSLHFTTLALYAAAENARTLAQYSESKGLYDLADRYAIQANNAEEWLRRVNAASLNMVNDSINYYNSNGEPDQDIGKDAYTAELIYMFADLKFCKPVDKTVSWVEYSMLHNWLLERGVEVKTWNIISQEGGYDLYVLYGSLKGKEFCFTADAATMNAQAYLTAGVVDEIPDYEEPDLTDFVIAAEAKQAYKKLDSYFEDRFGFVDAVKADINGDGKEDRIYGIINAMHPWESNFEFRENGEFNPFAESAAITVVTAEQTGGGVRIRITTLPKANSGIYSWSDGVLTIGTASYIYQKNGAAFIPGENQEETTEPAPEEETAKPTVKPENTGDMAISQLLLTTREEIRGYLQDYTDSPNSDGTKIYGEGWFNGCFIEVTLQQVDGTYRCTWLETVFGSTPVKVTPNLLSTASVNEAQNTLQPDRDWKLYKSEGDSIYYDIVYYYKNNFYYDFPTESAWYVTVRNKQVWDQENDCWGAYTFDGIQFMYSDSLNEETLNWLINSYK